MEIKAIKTSQDETNLRIDNQKKRSGVIDASSTKRIRWIEERILGAEYTIENIHKRVNPKISRKFRTQ